MRIALRVIGKLAFNQFGTEHKPGDLIHPDVFTQWPAGVVDARIANGWVKWEPVPDEGDPAPDEEPSIKDLDKAGLLLYAEQRFNTKLDARMSEANLRDQIGAMADRQSRLALVTATKKKPDAPSAPAVPAAVRGAPFDEPVVAPVAIVPDEEFTTTPEALAAAALTMTPVAKTEGVPETSPVSGDSKAEGPGGDQTQSPTGAGDSGTLTLSELVDELRESAPPADAGESVTIEQAPLADAGDTSASQAGQGDTGAASAS